MPGVEGTIASIDDSGNLITDVASEQLADAPRDEQVSIVCDEHETMGLYDADHDQPEMTFIAVLGNSGNLELTIVGDSARIMLGINVGEKVVVKW